MAKEQKGFVVYGDIKATADELTDDQLGQLFRGMIDYFVSGKCPRFTDSLKFAFIPIKQQMDRDAEKYEKRCEKNRENVQKRYERIQSNTNVYDGIRTYTNATNTNTNTNTNKDTNTNTKSAETDVSSLSLSLIKHLNDRTGSVYEADEATIGRVQTLLDFGYTPDQIRTVIDKKVDEWYGDTKMRTYLRPSTLFGDKFSEYLAAPISLAAERQQKADADRAALERSLSEKRQTLLVLKDSLTSADKTERRTLREQIAILEDSIGLIEKRIGGVA